jgi:hypothetical protein
VTDLWTLTLQAQWLDPAELAEAIALQLQEGDADFRTRLLMRDSLRALERQWGRRRVDSLMAERGVSQALAALRKERLGKAGFPSLYHRIVEPTRPETVRQFLRELGSLVHRPATLVVGGSISLILSDCLARATEDIDTVDEIPPELRAEHAALRDLAHRYGLHLAHFQSHYLPAGYAERLHSEGRFGKLDVWRVDPYDVFLSKLFSARTKDRDDLRALVPRLSKDQIIGRYRDSTTSLRAEERLLKNAATNWYILYGEPLPASEG